MLLKSAQKLLSLQLPVKVLCINSEKNFPSLTHSLTPGEGFKAYLKTPDYSAVCENPCCYSICNTNNSIIVSYYLCVLLLSVAANHTELVGVSQLMQQNSQVKKEQLTVPQLTFEQENCFIATVHPN